MKSSPSFTGSWDRTQSPTTNSQHRRTQCRSNPVMGTVSGGEDHVWFEDRWMVASLCDE
jgi:hypothetical protein